MTEPTYEFVKGQGWVLCAHQTIILERTYDGRKYRITVERRNPDAGERGWYFIADKFPDIQNEYIDKGYAFGWPALGNEPDYPGEILCTVKTELLT